MRRFLIVCATLLLTMAGLTWPTPAQAGELQLEIHGSGQHAYDHSFDPFGSGETPNVFGSANFGVGYTLDDLIGLDGLAIYGVVGREGLDRERFNADFNFGWRRMLYLAGVEYGYDIGGFFRPFARLTAGVAHQRLELTPPEEATLSESKVGFATRPSAGIELHTPYRNSSPDESSSPLALADNFTLGLTLEAGYLWQTHADYDGLEGPSSERGDDEWSRQGVDLGRLNANGWFWAVGAMMRIRL